MYNTNWRDTSHIFALSNVIKMKQARGGGWRVGEGAAKGTLLITELFKVVMALWDGRENSKENCLLSGKTLLPAPVLAAICPAEAVVLGVWHREKLQLKFWAVVHRWLISAEALEVKYDDSPQPHICLLRSRRSLCDLRDIFWRLTAPQRFPNFNLNLQSWFQVKQPDNYAAIYILELQT